jgi:glycosyltransferase involved in cell wall biosynthesis
VIFTAEDHLNAIVTLAAILTGSKAKLSASSRITPYRVYSDKLFSKKWVLKYFSIFLRNRVDALVCVSQDMVKEYEAIFGSSKFQCIYNVICDADMPRKMLEPVDDPWINDSSIPVVISAGTLSKRKGFADLILAMKIVTKNTPARLVILGEGHLRAELDALIQNEGLTDSVRLLGFQDNPLKYFSKSAVFVLSSYAEGLPNVLVEAIACGCTPVATDCPTGPREVLNGGQYGYLIPMRDPEAMATAIQKALQQPMSLEQRSEAIKPFTEEQVIRRHQSVLGF